MAQIHELIGKAMREIGAIGKDSVNSQQKFKYRGIDAVYNALNPVMAKYGMFICPEVLDQQREERQTANGGLLKYTILTIKYTVYAPDGSNIAVTVVGEGMDSGDKSSNKAMSIAMKYAMFQLFFIPTEDLKDPDADVYDDVLPKKSTKKAQNVPSPAPAAPAVQKTQPAAQAPQKSAVKVTTGDQVPAPAAPVAELSDSAQRLKNEIAFMQQEYGIYSFDEMKAKFMAMRKALIDGGVVENIKVLELSEEQLEYLVSAIYKNYPPVKNA